MYAAPHNFYQLPSYNIKIIMKNPFLFVHINVAMISNRNCHYKCIGNILYCSRYTRQYDIAGAGYATLKIPEIILNKINIQ